MLKYLSAVCAMCALLGAYSSGPPDAKTGRPGEGTCNDCHTGPAGSGDSTDLTGVPGNTYSPDSNYLLTLGLRFAGQARWGFELTTVDAAGQRAGQLSVTDPLHTQLSTAGPNYLKHTLTGTRAGTPGPVSWTFGWRAPVAGTGPVTFYWCANAANNDGLNTGDAVCCDSLLLTEALSVAEMRPSCGRLLWRYANPSRNRVIIRYRGRAGRNVRIYSASGRLVRTIAPEADGDMLRLTWDGRDSFGRVVPQASYFVRTGDEVRSDARIQLVR